MRATISQCGRRGRRAWASTKTSALACRTARRANTSCSPRPARLACGWSGRATPSLDRRRRLERVPDVSTPTAAALIPAVIGTTLSIVGFVMKLRRDKRLRRAQREIEEGLVSDPPPARPGFGTLPVPIELWARMEQTVRAEADWKVAAHRAKWESDELRRALGKRDALIAELEGKLANSRHLVQGLREELDHHQRSLQSAQHLRPDDAHRTHPVPVGRGGLPGRPLVAVAPGDRPTRRPIPGKTPQGHGSE